MSAVRVACLQLSPEVGDTPGNVERAIRAIAEERDRGARLIVLPELATSGYAFRDAEEARAAAEPLDGPAVTALREASRGGLVIVAGVCELGGDDRVYNTAVLLEDGELRASYRKLHLWGDERRFFDEGGQEPPVVQTAVGRIGVAICYDLEFPELTRAMALRGAEMLALPTNWPRVETPPGERPMLHTIVMATARLSRVWILLCDRGGEERGVRYLAGSIIASPDGWPVDSSFPDSPRDRVRGDCDAALARDKRVGDRNDVFSDRRPGFYGGG